MGDSQTVAITATPTVATMRESIRSRFRTRVPSGRRFLQKTAIFASSAQGMAAVGIGPSLVENVEFVIPPLRPSESELGTPLEHIEVSLLSASIQDAVAVVELDPPVLLRIPGDRAGQPRHRLRRRWRHPSDRRTNTVRTLPMLRARRGQSRMASAARTCRRSVRPHG